MESQSSPRAVLERVLTAQNAHDLDAFIACFEADYHSEQPVHPDRAFSGSEQVRKNWSAMLSSTPNFHAQLLGTAVEGDTCWAEWRWFGRRVDGTQLELRGVSISGVRNGRIAWQRLYLEEVEQAGAGIDAVVRHLTHETPREG